MGPRFIAHKALFVYVHVDLLVMTPRLDRAVTEEDCTSHRSPMMIRTARNGGDAPGIHCSTMSVLACHQETGRGTMQACESVRLIDCSR